MLLPFISSLKLLLKSFIIANFYTSTAMLVYMNDDVNDFMDAFPIFLQLVVAAIPSSKTVQRHFLEKISKFKYKNETSQSLETWLKPTPKCRGVLWSTTLISYWNLWILAGVIQLLNSICVHRSNIILFQAWFLLKLMTLFLDFYLS